jgi:hypothetical protein
MHRTATPTWRALIVAVAIGGLLAAGCGSDDDADTTATDTAGEASEAPGSAREADADDDGAGNGDARGSIASGAAGEWCGEFIDAFERIEAMNDDERVDDPAYYDEIMNEMRTAWQRLAETGPPEIRDDLVTVQQGIENLYVDDPDEDFLFDDDYIAASDRVEEYVRDTCGFDIDD